MKTTIDLTENNKFRDKKLHSRYKNCRKKLPWKENYSEEECVKLELNNGFTPYASFKYNPSTTEWLISMNDNRLTSHWTYTNYSTMDTVSTDYFSTSFYINTDSGYNFRLGKYNYTSTNVDIGYKETKHNIKNYGNFYTGHVKYIRELYKNCIDKFNVKRYKSYSICNVCCEKIKGPAIFKDNSYVNVDRYICDKCKDENRRARYRFNRNREGIGMFHPEKYSNAVRSNKAPSIPCISNDIPQDRKDAKYAGGNTLLCYSLYENDSILNNNKMRHELYKSHRVYKKGQILSGREQPFQPKGRVRQQYDDLFNDIEWKDMIGHK